MIKRRFYRIEHADKNEASSSDSSSDSEVEPEASDASEDDAVPKGKDQSEASTSSGYESEDSSGNQIDANLSDEDDDTGNNRQIPLIPQLSGKRGAVTLKKELNVMAGEESLPADMPDCVLKCKSVYRCRICPRVVCLTVETMRTHLHSKRHSRSEKLLKENRLKAVLNSDGEIENQETPAEMHARIVALAQGKLKKKNKGRQRQRKRSRKQKSTDASRIEEGRASEKNPAKKRLKNER